MRGVIAGSNYETERSRGQYCSEDFRPALSLPTEKMRLFAEDEQVIHRSPAQGLRSL